VIGRNYLTLEGLFRDPDGRLADVPLIKFIFEPEGTRSYAKEQSGASDAMEIDASSASAKNDAAPANLEPDPLPVLSCREVTGALAAACLNFEVLDDMDEPITPTGDAPYWLQPERAVLYKQKNADINADGSNCVCMTAKTSEDVICEVLLLLDSNCAAPAESIMCEDAISMEALPVSSLVEYQFVKGGRWLVCGCGRESIGYYKEQKFKVYEENVKALPVPCMKSLQRMLQNGPVNTLFDSSVFVTPPDELADWTVVNEDTGKEMMIPRPVFSLRAWDPEKRKYETVDHRLTGAPKTDGDMKAWFKKTIIYLKTNLHAKGNTDLEITKLGSKELNELVTRNSFSNRWSEMVVALEPPF